MCEFEVRFTVTTSEQVRSSVRSKSVLPGELECSEEEVTQLVCCETLLLLVELHKQAEWLGHL